MGRRFTNATSCSRNQRFTNATSCSRSQRFAHATSKRFANATRSQRFTHATRSQRFTHATCRCSRSQHLMSQGVDRRGVWRNLCLIDGRSQRFMPEGVDRGRSCRSERSLSMLIDGRVRLKCVVSPAVLLSARLLKMVGEKKKNFFGRWSCSFEMCRQSSSIAECSFVEDGRREKKVTAIPSTL